MTEYDNMKANRFSTRYNFLPNKTSWFSNNWHDAVSLSWCVIEKCFWVPYVFSSEVLKWTPPHSPSKCLPKNYNFQQAFNLKFCVNFSLTRSRSRKGSVSEGHLSNKKKSINAEANLCSRKVESENEAPDPDL